MDLSIKKVVLIFLNRDGGTLKCASRLADAFPENTELKIFVSNQANPDLLPNKRPYVNVNTGSNKLSNIFCSLNPLGYSKLLKETKNFNPDIIHFPIEHAWNFIFLLALKKYPIVQTIHDPVRHMGEENFFYDYLRHLAINRADRIIVLSNQFKKSFEAYGVGENYVDVIPHGSFSFSEKFTDPPLNKKILFAGRINKYKGVDILLKAFPIVLEKHPDAQLIIAGNGDLSNCENLIKNTRNLTIINRYLSEQELQDLHDNCDFVVAPYLQASQSGVIALAAANGRAVIATKTGGLPEQILDGQTGILVESANVGQLAKAILYLLEDSSKTLWMGRNAAEEYEKNHSWDKIAQDTLSTYLEAIKSFKLKDSKKKKTVSFFLYSAYKSYCVERWEKD